MDDHEQRGSMDYPELRNRMFGTVLVELMEARGMNAAPDAVALLAESADLDVCEVLDHMTCEAAGATAPLDGLAETLDLTRS